MPRRFLTLFQNAAVASVLWAALPQAAGAATGTEPPAELHDRPRALRRSYRGQ